MPRRSACPRLLCKGPAAFLHWLLCPQVAACAAGVLLNLQRLQAPTVGGTGAAAAAAAAAEPQQGLAKGLAGVLAAAAIYSSLFGAAPTLGGEQAVRQEEPPRPAAAT